MEASKQSKPVQQSQPLKQSKQSQVVEQIKLVQQIKPIKFSNLSPFSKQIEAAVNACNTIEIYDFDRTLSLNIIREDFYKSGFINHIESWYLSQDRQKITLKLFTESHIDHVLTHYAFSSKLRIMGSPVSMSPVLPVAFDTYNSYLIQIKSQKDIKAIHDLLNQHLFFKMRYNWENKKKQKNEIVIYKTYEDMPLKIMEINAKLKEKGLWAHIYNIDCIYTIYVQHFLPCGYFTKQKAVSLMNQAFQDVIKDWYSFFNITVFSEKYLKNEDPQTTTHSSQIYGVIQGNFPAQTLDLHHHLTSFVAQLSPKLVTPIKLLRHYQDDNSCMIMAKTLIMPAELRFGEFWLKIKKAFFQVIDSQFAIQLTPIGICTKKYSATLTFCDKYATNAFLGKWESCAQALAMFFHDNKPNFERYLSKEQLRTKRFLKKQLKQQEEEERI